MLNDARAAGRVQLAALAEEYAGRFSALSAPTPALVAARRQAVATWPRITTDPVGAGAALLRVVESVLDVPNLPADWAFFTGGFADVTTYAARIAKVAAQRAPSEDLVARQLARAGLRVIRVPGRYISRSSANVEQANFMNGEGGTNDAGQRYYITQGADAPYRAAFEAALARGARGDVPRVHYLDQAFSEESLALQGGVNCRVVVSREADDPH